MLSKLVLQCLDAGVRVTVIVVYCSDGGNYSHFCEFVKGLHDAVNLLPFVSCLSPLSDVVAVAKHFLSYVQPLRNCDMKL